jgi:glycerol kinase
MTANEVLVQFQADMLDTKVLRPSMPEVTAFGSALAAGLATGVWSSIEEAAEMQKAMCDYAEFLPAMSHADRSLRKTKWADAIQRSLNQA